MKKLIKMYNEKYGNTLGIIDDDFNKEQMYRIYYFIKNNCDDKDIQARLEKIKLDKPKTLEQQLTKLEGENNKDVKKYVDDNTIIHPLPIYKKSESPSMITYMVNILDLKKLTTYGAIRDMDSTKYQQYRFIYPCDNGKNKTIVSTADDINDTTFRISHYNNSSTLSFNNINYTIDYTKHSTPTDVIVTESIQKYLGIYNTHEYTPTENYHPATKKYVDDNKIAHTISSKVIATVLASDIKLEKLNNINNVSINKDRRYFIGFLGSKKLCSLSISEENSNAISCSIGNYSIQAYNNSPNIVINIEKINEDDTTTVTFTDLVIYEEEVKYLDSKYLETDLTLQNSISLGRVGDIGVGSSAIGIGVEASGDCSHAEGNYIQAKGDMSHAEGNNTTASGEASHAEGDGAIASGDCSHAEGACTIASGECSHVQGKFNIEDKANKYAHIVGNGANDTNRANAHTLDWEGNGWYAGKLSQEGTPTEDKDLTTKKYVDDKITSLPQFSFNASGELVVTINGVSKIFVPKAE